MLTRRYVAIWRGDRQALAGASRARASWSPSCSAWSSANLDDVSDPIERRAQTVNLLFLLAVSCFWFGCNTAAKELVKERVIFLRERDFNLRVGSYFASKFLVLALIGAAAGDPALRDRPALVPAARAGGRPVGHARRAGGRRDGGRAPDLGRGPDRRRWRRPWCRSRSSRRSSWRGWSPRSKGSSS